MMQYSLKKGVSLVEVIIAVTIATTAIVATIGVVSSALARQRDLARSVQATLLAEEGVEAMRFIRDSGWATTSALTLDADYFPVFDGIGWRLQATQPGFVFNLFDRRVRVFSVSRSASQDIVLSGGTVDADIKKVRVTVAWRGRTATTTRTMETYLGNLF